MSVQGAIRSCLSVMLGVAATSVAAAPSISGTSGNWITGGSVTVTGSSFGSTGAPDLLMDDFQSASGVIISGSVSRTPPVRTGFFASTTLQYGCAGSACSSHNYFTATTNPLPGQTKFARTSFDTFNSWNQSVSIDMSPSTLYSSYYWRRTPIDGHIGRQFKTWVGYAVISGNSVDRNYFSAGLGTSEGGEEPSFRQHVSGVSEQWFNTQSTECTNSWCRIENYIRYSNGSTGQWDSSIHTSTGVETINRSNIQTTSDQTPVNHDFIGAYFDLNTAGTGTSHVDSAKFVLSLTPSRVELCTGSTWANRGTCDYQRPTSWSTTSVTIVPDTLRWSSGQTAYAYLCDSTDSCSTTGFAITINAGSGGVAPVVTSVSCTPTLSQAPAATTCIATASGDTPITWQWTGEGSSCSFSAPTTSNTLLNCSYGGARTPCITATNASGSDQGCVAANSVVWRYLKPTGFGATP